VKLAASILVLLAASGAFAEGTPTPTPSPTLPERCERLLPGRTELPADQRLHKLFEATWDFLMAESPDAATDNGYPGHNNRWRDWSPEAIEYWNRAVEAPARVLATIDRGALSEADRLNYDLFKTSLDFVLEGRAHKAEYLLVNQLGGAHLDVEQYVRLMPAGSVADYETIVARLQAVPRFIDQNIALMREGMARGITTPRVVLRDVPEQVRAQIVDDPLSSALLGAFKTFPETISAADRERLTGAAQEAYRKHVVPSYRTLERFLTGEYLPKARETVGLSDLPGGKDWYAYNVRYTTTTNLSPREIHELGLAEVKRLRAAMEAVIAEADGPKTFAEFAAFVKRDARFFYAERDELLRGYRDIAKRADPELVRLFARLPRQPYGVVATPANSEKSAPTGFYMQGAGGRAAQFYANTYNLAARPKWEMEALTLHEAVPGHHLQISLAQELENVPEFRKYGFPDFRRLGYMTAFVEGWALYAEGLGYDMGFYKDPYARFGQLSFEIWRAVRLVVDTGMHSMGWTRQRAIDYFKANSSRADHDIVAEIDRYIVWPGQALGYKVGQLRIRDLRARAERELGPRFDVRAFHDALLGQGALPLDVLERRVSEWIAERNKT
jgi:uncharacterized protein (DUF885 family)